KSHKKESREEVDRISRLLHSASFFPLCAFLCLLWLFSSSTSSKSAIEVFSFPRWRFGRYGVGLLVAAFAEAVTDASDGLDQVGDFQFAPKRFDVNVDGAFQDNRSIADGGVHELMPREGPARLAQHAFEQPELRWRQLQFTAFHEGAMAHPVDA